MKTIRSARISALTAILVAALAACTGGTGQPRETTSSGASQTASAAPSASQATPSASAPASPSASPSAAPVSETPATPAPEPTAQLAQFDCTLPWSLPATVDRAQIVDVRVGSHGSGASGYDRIVFQFQGSGIPEVTLRAGTPPFTKDPSGLPLAVRGNSFLVLVLHGGTAITPDGRITYSGSTDFRPGFPALTEFSQAGDFEAVSEWVAGLSGPSCHRLFVLKSPTRLVLDVQHPQG